MGQNSWFWVQAGNTVGAQVKILCSFFSFEQVLGQFYN